VKKILVGDRNIALQKLIELRLSDRELSVLMTSDTEDTKDAMEKGPVDLMILDIDLPNEGALPIYKKLKSSPELAHVPVMLLVKGMQKDDPRLNDYKGIDKALARPFEASDFISAIGQLLDKCSQPVEAIEDLINTIPQKNKDEQLDKEAEIVATREVQDNILTDLPDSLIEENTKDSQGEITASQEVQDDILSGITDAIIDEKNKEEKEEAQPEILSDIANAITDEDEEVEEEAEEEVKEEAQEETDEELQSEAAAVREEAQGDTPGIIEDGISEKEKKEDLPDFADFIADGAEEEVEEEVKEETEKGPHLDNLSMEKWLKKIIIERVDKEINTSLKKLLDVEVRSLVDELAEKLILEEIEKIKKGGGKLRNRWS